MVALKIFFVSRPRRACVQRDPTDSLSLPRIDRYLPETLNELQVEQLLESVDCKAPLGLRDRAMLELLYASGLRISELAGAKLENLNLEEGVVRVTGKGNKTRARPGRTQGLCGDRQLPGRGAACDSLSGGAG